MKIVISDVFRDVISKKYGIRPTHAEAVVRSPDKHSKVIGDGIEIGIYSKLISPAKKPFTLIVLGRRDGEDQQIEYAFKAFDDLCEDFDVLEPIELLEQFANRFGVDLQVGAIAVRFVRNQVFEVDDLDQSVLMSGSPGQGRDLISCFYMRLTKADDGRKKLECALCLAIDVHSYTNRLSQH